MTELKQALICLNKRASATSTRNLLQECIWTARITGRKIIKYLPITFEFLLYKSIYSKQPGLKPLPEKFANKYIRLWYIICYRKDILCDYLLNNMNTPEINKMVTHIVFSYNSKYSYPSQIYPGNKLMYHIDYAKLNNYFRQYI